MEKIVDLKDRLENKKQRRRLEQYQRKIETVQKVTQCASCRFHCAMCGRHLSEPDDPQNRGSTDYGFPFCETCRGEFKDFLSISNSGIHSGLFWHNKEWREMWSAWLHYQKAIADFAHSPEYMLLLDELDSVE